MALAAAPDVLVLDEPTTALDATVEAEVLELVEELQSELDAAIVPDQPRPAGGLAALRPRGAALRRAALGGGPGGGSSARRAIRTRSRCSGACRVAADQLRTRLEPIRAAPGSGESAAGCVFADRCPIVRPRCRTETPPPSPVADGWTSRCHYHGDVQGIARVPSPNGQAAVPDEVPLLRVERVTKRTGRAAVVEAVADVSLDLRRRRSPRARGRVRQRKDVARTLHRRPRRAVRRDARAERRPPSRGRCATGRRTCGGRCRWCSRTRTERSTALSRSGGYSAARSAVSGRPTVTRRSRSRDPRPPLAGRARARPHALSGGTKQRVALARSFAGEPRVVICDEPVSDLDPSVQAAILNLVRDLREQQGISYLFISHDLSVVRYVADRIAVMYLGWLVELAPTDALFEPPHHPYTEALISAVPAFPTEAAATHHALWPAAEPEQAADGVPLPHALPPLPRRGLPDVGAAVA